MESSPGAQQPVASILMVDDHAANLLALESLLAPLGQRLVRAHDGREALKHLLREEFALILMDVEMPGLDGFETAALMKQREKTRHVPIIFLTATAEDSEKVFRGYAQGAVDYIQKPFDPIVLRSKVQVFVELHRYREQARQQAELLRVRELQALEREQEASFRGLTEAIPQMVWTARPDGAADYFNGRWFEYTGLGEIELLGWGWLQALHPEDRQHCLELWRASMASGQPLELEYRWRRSDGAYRWLLGRARPVRDAQGQITKWFGTCTDIHDQRRDRESWRFLSECSKALTASLDYRATLASVARLAVPRFADFCAVELGSDPATSGQLVLVDRRGADTLEPAPDLRRCFPHDPHGTRGLAAVLRTGKTEFIPHITDELLASLCPQREDLAAIQTLGPRSAILVPLIARGEVLGAFTFIWADSGRRYEPADVTLAEELAMRAAQAIDNARLYEEAQQAIRLRDEFLSVASHELKTPLTPLQLRLDSLLRDAELREGQPPSPGRFTAGLEVLRRQVRRLSELVHELLDVSRISAGRLGLQLEEVDLAHVVSDVVARFGQQALQANSLLELRLSGPVIGRWDRLRLEQVTTNLLTNAIKYGAGKPISIHVEDSGGSARLRISDHGIGIAAEDVQRIFGRFERAVSERHYGGLGLGLYIVRQIVDAFGGEIRVVSAPGQGSTFDVLLPRHARRATRPATEALRLGPSPASASPAPASPDPWR